MRTRLSRWVIAGGTALLVSASSVSAQPGLTSPSAQLVSGRDPMLPDPATRSGWIRVEVAVITDDSVAALNAETWPATPSARYPSQWRWLTNLEEASRLEAQFEGAEVQVGELGAVTVTLPPPPPPEPEVALLPTDPTDDADPNDDTARETRGEPLAMGTAASPSIDPLTGRPEDALLTNAVPLESLGARPTPTGDDPDADDWLEPFAESGSLADAAAMLEAGETTEQPDNEASDAVPAEPVYTPPPEPVPFAQRPTEMLAEGLRALTRKRGVPPVIESAWVQPPGEKNLPIILDGSGDAVMWPALQGFVELRRGNDLRVGVNFWLNTMGDYLPAGFAMDPPPRAEPRVSVVKADPAPLVGTELGPRVDLAVAGELRPAADANSASGQSIDGLVSYVDPISGLDVTGPAGTVDTGTLSDADGWPYRHLIQIADTRSVPENGVRYYDHPVVQVLVTWKELTWGEVWQLGEADSAALAALEAAAEEAAASRDAGILPPSMINRE